MEACFKTPLPLQGPLAAQPGNSKAGPSVSLSTGRQDKLPPNDALLASRRLQAALHHNGAKLMHGHLKSIVKALSWRVLGAIDTMLLSLIVTNSVTMALGVVGIEFFTKTALYYAHERAWAWGSKSTS
jgi:uncharacterized membrane protein